ncbi:hypothetical protein PVAP13_8NG034001 [Panicum virgatum]|uniref:Uncharacterized protein n=1 Tax=Panicum virgatum TaxID=38727 RepID=A0A8T0P569_PANVG|nr:hypothetical protein PVAP13_8NG034001 [Panicum virgatum]
MEWKLPMLINSCNLQVARGAIPTRAELKITKVCLLDRLTALLLPARVI